MLTEQEKYVPPINDIECREPIITEKSSVPLDFDNSIIACNRIRGVVEGVAVAAIFTILGLLIWSVC